MVNYSAWEKGILLIIFYGLLALSLLAPIASNQYIPDCLDYGDHIAGIVQAKMALVEGQFPIRTAPWQNEGLGNAYFQFYSPLAYTVAGIVYAINDSFTQGQANPFLAYKIIVWLVTLLAGIYFYRLAYWLTQSRPVALLSGALYIMAPYYLININTRGDFTETIAQGLIPLTLYYTLKNYLEDINFKSAALMSIAWFALITTHLVTFLYASIFIGIFLFILTLKKMSTWKHLFVVGIIYAYSWLLALFYIAPILLTKNYLIMNDKIGNPFGQNWLTPISSLLSVNAVSPMPLPGNHLLPMTLYSAVGWPILLTIGLASYLYITKTFRSDKKTDKLVVPLLLIFFLALFATWSPLNFWGYLPSYIGAAQFTYRLLTQTMWPGALLFACIIQAAAKEKITALHVVIGLLLIGLCAGSWLPTTKSGNVNLADLKIQPDLGYGQSQYLVNSHYIPNSLTTGGTDLPLTDGGGWLEVGDNQQTTIPTDLIKNSPDANLQLTGNLSPTYYKEPLTLTLEINGQKTETKSFPAGHIQWDIPLYQWVKSFNEKEFIIKFSATNAFVPNTADPKSPDTRKITVNVETLSLTNLRPEDTMLPVTAILKSCTRVKTKTICNITLPAQASYVQLPIFYYPKLLDIRVNGKKTAYIPTVNREFVLAGIKLPPGNYKVTAEFVGLMWANWLSTAAWLLLLIATLFSRKRPQQDIKV